MSVKEGVHMRGIDPEAQHEAEEVDIEALLRKIESLEAVLERKTMGKTPVDPRVPGGRNHMSKAPGDPSVPGGMTDRRGTVPSSEDPSGLVTLASLNKPRSEPGSQTRLNRLTEYKNKQGDVSSVLAWDDLTGMKLEAGKVIEARAKEVWYIRDKRVYTKILRSQASRSGW